MNTEELNTTLYKKMFAEQESYKAWLLEQPPEEILNHAYEYTVREDILISLEVNNLTDAQAEALLASPTPLNDVFRKFENCETDYMETIWSCLESRADDMIQREKEALRNTPVYLHSGAYARENNELEMYRASYKANVACKEALEKAIQENYVDNCFDPAAVYDDVVARFGPERVKHVLATTIRHKEWDGRFSHDNKTWAQSVPMEASFGAGENDRSVYYVVDRPHSVLTDSFTSHFRKEYQAPRRESVLEKLRQPMPGQVPTPKKAVTPPER